MSASAIVARRSVEGLPARYVTCDTSRVAPLVQTNRRIAPPGRPQRTNGVHERRAIHNALMSYTRETILEAF